MTVKRHCERSVAIQCMRRLSFWIAASQAPRDDELGASDSRSRIGSKLIAMTVLKQLGSDPDQDTSRTRLRRLILCHSTALGMSMAMACMHLSSQPCLFCILSMALPRSLAMVIP